MPALQIQSPEFKPQYHHKKKNKRKERIGKTGVVVYAYNPSSEAGGA
jgi:hypothetical protein